MYKDKSTEWLIDEVKGLYDAIYNIECYSSGDLQRYDSAVAELMNRDINVATKLTFDSDTSQIEKLYQEKLDQFMNIHKDYINEYYNGDEPLRTPLDYFHEASNWSEEGQSDAMFFDLGVICGVLSVKNQH